MRDIYDVSDDYTKRKNTIAEKLPIATDAQTEALLIIAKQLTLLNSNINAFGSRIDLLLSNLTKELSQ